MEEDIPWDKAGFGEGSGPASAWEVLSVQAGSTCRVFTLPLLPKPLPRWFQNESPASPRQGGPESTCALYNYWPRGRKPATADLE